jgi:methionyl-tRNA synthetase
MKKYYVTTPIYYINDVPHIGHTYTTIAADTIARYKKLVGCEVFFLTGTDEHGQKVEKAAISKGEDPQVWADRISDEFRRTWKCLDISNNDFIRTTQERHRQGCEVIFQRVMDVGDIYLGEYEDWYCTPDETFWTESQLDPQGNCPECGRPVEKLKEKSYFFRLSRYQQPLLEYMERQPDFIIPQSRYNEVLKFIQGGLKDLSISRTSFSWGIPLPNDPEHILYVWFDALINYLTGIGFPSNMALFDKFWPADVHLMSKDILRHHAVYWPAFLMSAGLALPKRIVVHGWWTVEGKKMSKSLGNAIDPHFLIEKYGVDPLRYFLLREIPFGGDGDFSRRALIGRINSDLANDLGNVLHRTLAMIKKYFHEEIPPSPDSSDPLIDSIFEALPEIDSFMETLSFNRALSCIWGLINRINKMIDERAPWALYKDESRHEELKEVMFFTVYAIALIAVLLVPFMPKSAQTVWERLGFCGPIEECTLSDLPSLKDRLAGQQIKIGSPLFPKVELEE